jgi:hypothetical protein
VQLRVGRRVTLITKEAFGVQSRGSCVSKGITYEGSDAIWE